MTNKEKLNDNLPIIVTFILCIALFLLPTGFEGALIRDGAERVKSTVLETDDSQIKDTGLVRSGEQSCLVRLESGSFKGQTFNAANILSGSLEQDAIYTEGDSALVLVSQAGGAVSSVSMIDHYRIEKEAVLAAAFFLFLIAFAGKTGIRAILSFILTLLAIWKMLIPLCLKGFDPLIAGGVMSCALTILIIALVYGFDKRCLAACIGAITGLSATAAMGIAATCGLKIHGAVMAYSESLLYSGYQSLNLTRIFMASIFIGSSGAMMDLAVDITSAVHEVLQKRPDLSRKEAIRSGMNVGRAAMGTMTTTLLLAYSGGFIALLMVFMAQGTPIINILNYKYVSSELIHTIVGSFGLVTVAPLTAAASGYILAKGGKINKPHSLIE
ncbi:MAG: YibE/F family protein [Clostridiaceae bacterium]|nr:YibE/F family protein [Clostridiaceae bacterium]